jgi:hypothetical protein
VNLLVSATDAGCMTAAFPFVSREAEILYNGIRTVRKWKGLRKQWYFFRNFLDFIAESNEPSRNPLTDRISEQIMRIIRRPSLMGIILPAHTVKTLEIRQPGPADFRYDRKCAAPVKRKGGGADHNYYHIIYGNIASGNQRK